MRELTMRGASSKQRNGVTGGILRIVTRNPLPCLEVE